MNLLDAEGVILIAVDDKFTLEDKDGLVVNRESIHRQFLNKYYIEESEYKGKIAKIVAEKGNATEVAIKIEDKKFVLFAYSSQGNIEDYANRRAYERGFVLIPDSLKNVFAYCKKHFPNEVVHTALIGTGIQNKYRKKLDSWYSASEDTINAMAKEVGIEVKIIKKSDNHSC